MNERIKSLIERAEYQAKKQSGYEDWEVYVPSDSQVVFEKFAELIVKECVGIVAKRKDQAIDDGCNVDEAMSVAEMDLLEHFGVEE
jgi:glutamate/tyrosine decarboxylase-like PLP-dependent enzyme